MKIGIWYWHTPFDVSKDELGLLNKIGVSTIYVRTLTFTTDGVRVKPEFPQHWNSNAGGLPVVLTFNFDAGLRSHFEELPNAGIATAIANGITRARQYAVNHQINVTGVQMDVDCPTRLLEKYADLLTKLRPELTKQGALLTKDSFSATALQTWLTSKSYVNLADACDFVAPQFYEGRVGTEISRVQPIADDQNLKPGMEQANSTGRPFYAGIATYGHALLYDDRGELAGMYHGLPPEDALRHPSLKFERTYPLAEDGSEADAKTSIGENLLLLKAVRPDLKGRGLGFHVAYVLPSAEMLARQLRVIRESRPTNCQGVILYRFPEPNDEMSLPLQTVADTFEGKATTVSLKSEIARKSVPWSMIDGGERAKTPPYDYTVTVKSVGNAASLAAPDALSVLIAFDGTGLSEVRPGDFDEIHTGVLVEGNRFQPCAPSHANAVLLRRYHVLPGDRLRSGPLEVDADGPSPTHLYWNVRPEGGFGALSGSIVPSFDHPSDSETHS
jgi:hypothetical protein